MAVVAASPKRGVPMAVVQNVRVQKDNVQRANVQKASVMPVAAKAEPMPTPVVIGAHRVVSARRAVMTIKSVQL